MSVQSGYRRLFSGKAQFNAGAGNSSTGLHESASNSLSGNGGGLNGFYLDPLELGLPGQSVKLRMRNLVTTNAVAPGLDFTVGLYPATPAGGGATAVTLTAGTIVSGSSAVVTSPALTVVVTALSTEFDCPAAGLYVVQVTLGAATMPTSSSAIVRATLLGRVA